MVYTLDCHSSWFAMWFFIEAFVEFLLKLCGYVVEDFVAILDATPFATRFATKKWSWKNGRNFVKDFVASTQVQSKFWQNPEEILTKEFVAKSCGKMFCHKAPDEKPNEFLTKKQTKETSYTSYTSKILQVVDYHAGVPLQFIPIKLCWERFHEIGFYLSFT
jgi:hypothetical protein